MNIKFNKKKIKSFFFIVQAISNIVLISINVYNESKKLKKDGDK